MTIETLGGENPSHIENVIWDVRCFSCPKISEENGDYLPGPAELADITENLTHEQAREIAECHETKYGESHEIVLRGFDIGKIQETVGI